MPENCHPDVRKILGYWLSIKPNDGLPDRRQLDPLQFFEHLANIRIVDVIGDPPRFRIGLTGERIREHFGTAQAGVFFDEVFPDFEERDSHAAFTTAVRTAAPFWGRGICELDQQRDHVKLERIVLPLADDDGDVGALLIMSLLGEAEDCPGDGPEPSSA